MRARKIRYFISFQPAIIFCFLLVGQIISCGGVGGTPEATIKEFINAISHGDAKFAFKQFVENGEAIVNEEWEGNWDRIQGKLRRRRT